MSDHDRDEYAKLGQPGEPGKEGAPGKPGLGGGGAGGKGGAGGAGGTVRVIPTGWRHYLLGDAPLRRVLVYVGLLVAAAVIFRGQQAHIGANDAKIAANKERLDRINESRDLRLFFVAKADYATCLSQNLAVRQNDLKMVLLAALVKATAPTGRPGTAGAAYYQAHPDELAAAQKETRKVYAVLTSPVHVLDCAKLPSILSLPPGQARSITRGG